MSTGKQYVTIKGVKDGLIFLLDDSCEFSNLLKELEHKLENTYQKFLEGPLIHVHVKLGERVIDDEQKTAIREIIGQKGNLLIQSIESEPSPSPEKLKQLIKSDLTMVRGIVRSGQTIQHEGNLLYVGDVNPGGTIMSTGDIYILGSLRGIAHAGTNGNEKAVIVASHLRPTQLRIAGVFSRPPEEWGFDESYMEFAYLDQGQMKIERVSHLHRTI